MNTRRMCNEILADLIRETMRAPDVVRQAVGAVACDEYDVAAHVLDLSDDSSLKRLLSLARRNPARVVLDGLNYMASR